MSAYLICYIETKIGTTSDSSTVLSRKSKEPIADYRDLTENIKRYATLHGIKYTLNDDGSLPDKSLSFIIDEITKKKTKMLWNSEMSENFGTGKFDIEILQRYIIFTCGTEWIGVDELKEINRDNIVSEFMYMYHDVKIPD